MDTLNLCGAAGRGFRFDRAAGDADWIRTPGVALFAAPDGRGWRPIGFCDLGGGEDLGAFWRWREARRYGAVAVFVMREEDFRVRRRALADLVAALGPVLAPAEGSEAQALAA
jgi:hypothetical protein